MSGRRPSASSDGNTANPKLVLYRDATRTECGVGQSAMGPFYCLADQQVELQADCFAGVWANRADAARGGRMIDDRDVEQALAAASAIGDDRLQRQAQGRVVPNSFTHGSSAQRMRWFRIGPDSGDPRKCDTFSAKQL